LDTLMAVETGPFLMLESRIVGIGQT
jgi:hypothetical protein